MGLISAGDFIDIYYKIKNRGLPFMLGKFSISAKTRTENTWNSTDEHSSNWWIIDTVIKRWNRLITGDPEMEYEDYITVKYLTGKNSISILSVGCGNGDHEVKFAKFDCVKKTIGIDIAAEPLRVAVDKALKANLTNLSFQKISFDDFNTAEKFDLIIFHSSLHHFKNIQNTLGKANQLLNDKGLLVINEYVGPSKFQFGKQRKDYLNKILKKIPSHFKQRLHSSSIKNCIYQPGTLRMIIADPSEAVSAADIMPCLNRQFNMLEEKKIGGDILHFLLKDIAHNFLNSDTETKIELEQLFTIEDEYILEKKYSDFMFGVYQKK